jgi:hypothetical protein
MVTVLLMPQGKMPPQWRLSPVFPPFSVDRRQIVAADAVREKIRHGLFTSTPVEVVASAHHRRRKRKSEA